MVEIASIGDCRTKESAGRAIALCRVVQGANQSPSFAAENKSLPNVGRPFLFIGALRSMWLDTGAPAPADVLPIGAHDKIGDTVTIDIAQRRHGYPKVAFLLFCRIQKGKEKCAILAAENEGFAGVDQF